MKLRFFRYLYRLAGRAFDRAEEKAIEQAKKKYGGKNPEYSCNCNDCWSAFVSRKW